MGLARDLKSSLAGRVMAMLAVTICALATLPVEAQERFGNYEIRVIRPKFMKKRGRVELAGEMTLVMNQSFIYSLLATGLLDYHFSESLAIEFGGSYGFSIDKEDKRILKDEFNIQTQILRTQYIATGGLLWTPVYGKTQLPSGQLVYFDSFFTIGGGMTGIEYTYEQCLDPNEVDEEDRDAVPPKPPATTAGYPTVVVGLGQKFFLTQDFGLRWDVRDHIFSYDPADGSCTPEEPSGTSKVHQNVTLQLGASSFF